MCQQPQRRDLVTVYMDAVHAQLSNVLAYYWEKRAMKLSAFDTLALIDWCNTYINELRNFGVHDTDFVNGFKNICLAYSRKVHMELNPLVVSIIQQESDFEQAVEETDPWFSTNAPSVLIGILQDRFTVILAKKIPELALKVLSVFTTIITKYQSALSKLYNKQEDTLPPEFVIAQCNNAFTFYELLEGMI